MIKTALVVDDDHLEREYMSELLLRSGIAVRSAASVPNAAALVKDMRFDCIFIDDLMPGDEDSAEALLCIRRAAVGIEGGRMPAYLMGDPADESAAAHIKNGFDGFLEKPVDLKKLKAVLEGRYASPRDESKGAAPLDNRQGRGEKTALSDIEGLDVKKGVANCGSMDNYMSALEIFLSTFEKKAGEIEGFFEAEDTANYTIKVHALKSSARIIGADALSDAARELEDAGNAGDKALIKKKTEPLLKSYRALGKSLAGVFDREEEKGKPVADEATIKDACRSIEEFAGQMDYDLVDMVLSSLSEYSLDKKDEEMFSRVRSALLELDWDTVAGEVSGR